jgi:hypothetical protein
MNLKALVTKYIVSAEQVLNELQRSKGAIIIPEENVINILEYIINYLEDAKYYKEQKKFETSLTSVAYCEGLLDALRLMGAVKFEWPVNEERKK